MIGNLTSEEITQVIVASVAIMLAFLEGVRRVLKLLKEIRADLHVNTTHSRKAEEAARAVQTAQIDQAELDFLRLWHKAYLELPECEPCKARVEALIASRKLRASDSLLTQRVVKAHKERGDKLYFNEEL